MRNAALWLVGACSFSPGVPANTGPSDANKDAVNPGDGRVFLDAPADAPDGCNGVGSFSICLGTQPTLPLTLNTLTIDTTACAGGELVDPQNGGPKLCVFAGSNVTITGN